MADVNVVVLVGRLTRDAELKYTNSGMPISRFSLAVNRRRKQGDQWVDEASFFEVDYWGKGAEAVNQYMTKGKQVAVEGELRQDRWEQDGQSRSKVIINANSVQLLGGGQGGNSPDRGGASPDRANQGGGAPDKGGNRDDQGGWQGKQQGGNAQRGPEQRAPESDDFSDEIPF